MTSGEREVLRPPATGSSNLRRASRECAHPASEAPGFLRGNVRRRAVCATGRRSGLRRAGTSRHSTTAHGLRLRLAVSDRGSVLGHVSRPRAQVREPRTANREPQPRTLPRSRPTLHPPEIAPSLDAPALWGPQSHSIVLAGLSAGSRAAPTTPRACARSAVGGFFAPAARTPSQESLAGTRVGGPRAHLRALVQRQKA